MEGVVEPLEAVQALCANSQAQAFSCLKGCIQQRHLKCISWLLERYPALVAPGFAYFSSIPHHSSCKRVAQVALLFLEAGAQPSRTPGRIDDGDLLWNWFMHNKHVDNAVKDAVASHFIDYGTWVSKWQNSPWLYVKWERRYRQRDARIEARKALWIALRRCRAPRDVICMVVRSAPLWEKLSWKRWRV